MNMNNLPVSRRNIGLKHVSLGTQSVLLRFERSVRALARDSETMPEYVRAKSALIRKLRRLEGTLPPSAQGRRRTPPERGS
jgi:hypothetical protein